METEQQEQPRPSFVPAPILKAKGAINLYYAAVGALALVVLALPIMLKSFFSSYRVRIGRNKRVYAAGFAAVLSSLIAFFVASYANRLFYMFPNYKENHFAYKYQAAKELAGELKK